MSPSVFISFKTQLCQSVRYVSFVVLTIVKVIILHRYIAV